MPDDRPHTTTPLRQRPQRVPAALIVAPEPLERRRLRHRLASAGFHPIHEAGNTPKAAQQLASVLLDTVFLRDSKETPSVEEMRRLAGRRSPNHNPQIFFLTDEDLETDNIQAIKSQAIKAGATAVLPVLPDPEVLTGLINQWHTLKA